MSAIADGPRFVMGQDVHPRKSGDLSFNSPGPGAYMSDSKFRTALKHNGKYHVTPGGSLTTANYGGLDRGYWTRGQFTKSGLTYCPFKDANQNGPAEHNLAGCTNDGRAPAFRALPEAHLRPRQTFGCAQRFRDVEKLGTIKSGIHNLVLPGPGTYLNATSPATRYTKQQNMAPSDGCLHSKAEPAAKSQAFGSSATGISADPLLRSDTPRGRQSWICGLAHAAPGGIAGSVSIQRNPATRQVVSDGKSKLVRSSSFTHSSFNIRCQSNSKNKLMFTQRPKKQNRHEPQNLACPVRPTSSVF
eukprot:TRINITY_DN18429_c0_g1_i1.p1 TRINITY_DN18429_c0_g1~~TRINITY_DN18429_c0_g1_i1.p1  ORF type:complete len:302 (-),score=13.68 TRINITY_DN18429_c0_g1_i1:191-1096(-)